MSEAKAEGERKAADAAAGADGEPNKAMRPDAAGAEVEGGMRDGGKAVRKSPKPEAAAKKTRTIITPKPKPGEEKP